MLMLMQHELISRVRDMCTSADGPDAALMYGSIAQGVGDEYSDIEFWLFFAEAPDPFAWCRRIAPSLAVTVNEFGAHVVFFEGLIRGEFHFATVSDLQAVAGWPALGAATDDLIVVDRRGELRELLDALPRRTRPAETPEQIDELCLRFANWLVLALHVTRRGEVLRAQDALAHARRHLLWMARLVAGATATWLTPSRRAESELPVSLVGHLHATLDADPAVALGVSWRLGREIWQELAGRHGLPSHAALWRELDRQAGLNLA